jgi:large subunit ribosomal protein L22
VAAIEKIFRATHRYAPIAPRKARLVADLVRGMPVNDALAVLDAHPRRAAYLLRKVLRSAMANASQDVDVDLNALVVEESRIDMGPLLGGRPRWRPRAQGRATPIRKRTSHLIIGLAEAPDRRKRRKRKSETRAEPDAATTTEEAAAEAAE